MDNVSILIVEKEAIIAADLYKKLESIGFNVIGVASNVEEATVIAKKMCPQLAVMDTDLFGTPTGVETAKAIQALCDRMPVLFLSCQPAALNVIEQANLTGAYACVAKPFVKDELVSQIEKVLNDSHACQNGAP